MIHTTLQYCTSFPPSPVGMRPDHKGRSALGVHTHVMQDKGDYAVQDRSICVPTREHGSERKRNAIIMPSNCVGRGALTPTILIQDCMEDVGVGVPRPTGFSPHKETGAGTSVPPNATEVASPTIKALPTTQYTNTQIHKYTVCNCTPYSSLHKKSQGDFL